MPTCSVPYCVNATGKDTRISFHEFPHETPLFLNKWLERIGRPNWRPGLRSVVCSEHFANDDYDRKGKLHIGSFPSKFPEAPSRKKRKTETEQDSIGPIAAPATQNIKPGTNIRILQSSRNKEHIYTKPLDTPVEKKVLNICIQKEPLQANTGANVSSACEEELSSVITRPLSVNASENVTNENIKGAKPENNCPTPTLKMAEETPKPSNISKVYVPKKRKILEERQPLLSNDAPVAAVLSSYSLLACRVCGLTSPTNVNIFAPEGKRLGLTQLINKCLPIQISESDSLPQSVCKLCISRLQLCHELIVKSEKTQNSFCGKTSQLLGTKDGDPPIIHSKPVHTQYPGKPSRRILLLEMALTDGIPVKSMITQAIKELNLRLTPKEARETKPQGRIMFLDLQGGPELFPEQMKKAIAMLFPHSLGDKGGKESTTLCPATPSKNSLNPKVVAPKIARKNVAQSPTRLQPMVPVTMAAPMAIRMQPMVCVPNVAANTAVQSKGSKPVLTQVAVPTMSVPITVQTTVANPNLGGTSALTPTTGQPLVVKSLITKVASPISNQNLFVQKAPVLSQVPLTLLPNPAATAGIRIATLPGNLAAGTLPQLIQLPSNNLIKIQPKPTSSTAETRRTSASPMVKDMDMTAMDISNDDNYHFFDDNSTTPFDDDPVPLASTKEATIEDQSKQKAGIETPIIDIARLKDKVVTKINNVGNQFKLGDKIIGIVLRNSDSKEDIHKKLQATFSSSTPLKTVPDRSKGRTISKGSVAIPGGMIPTAEAGDGTRKGKDPVFDVPSAVEDPSAVFDRRNIRKLSLSYMWRKTGFLVSSYQKLFTWQMTVEDDANNANPVLTCRVCKYAAKSKSEVETHMQAHPDLQCGLCYKYFLTVSKVHEHMGVIHHIANPSDTLKKKIVFSWRTNPIKRLPLKQYQCSRCERRFKMKDALKRHIDVCKDRLQAERDLLAKKSSALTCSYSQCIRSFKTVEELEDHALSHTKRSSWLCDICGLVLKSGSNYRTHIARHDELAHEYNFQCHLCKKRFKMQNRYDDHMKKHDVTQQFICSSCGKVFGTLHGLKQHELLHGERKLQCRFCPHRFHRRDHLRIHENSHVKGKRTHDSHRQPGSADTGSGSGSGAGSGSGSGRTYTCRFCISQRVVTRFTSMRELMRHYADEHTEERMQGTAGLKKKFGCDRCNRSFANSTLLRHHHMWHAGVFPYTCQFCGQGFMVKERLRNHENSHTNERPYKCPTCSKGFRSRVGLKQHRLLHKDPSEFLKCKYCDKTFSRPDNLRTHTRVHTGEKPWKCRECHRPFRLRSECTKHIQIGHQIPADQVKQYVVTVFDPNSSDLNEESSSAESVIESALAGITTVQDMELLIEADDLEECDTNSL